MTNVPLEVLSQLPLMRLRFGLDGGVDSATVREWVDSLTVERLSAPEGVDTSELKKKRAH